MPNICAKAIRSVVITIITVEIDAMVGSIWSRSALNMLRVSVEGGGCSGFQYRFDLVAERDADDLVIEKGGARVLIDPVSLGLLSGSEIDFVEDLMGAAFKVKNPNATASCGCGTSFAV